MLSVRCISSALTASPSLRKKSRARVLFGLMLLRRGHPQEAVLRHWQRSSPKSPRPRVPARYQELFRRAYGAPPDLEAIAPPAKVEPR